MPRFRSPRTERGARPGCDGLFLRRIALRAARRRYSAFRFRPSNSIRSTSVSTIARSKNLDVSAFIVNMAYSSCSTKLGGTQYHPSGISTRFSLNTHSSPTLVYTRALVSGPILTGLDSGTNTARLHPLANASASAAKTIAVHVSVHGAMP